MAREHFTPAAPKEARQALSCLETNQICTIVRHALPVFDCTGCECPTCDSYDLHGSFSVQGKPQLKCVTQGSSPLCACDGFPHPATMTLLCWKVARK